MSLVNDQKAQRRDRILEVAEALIAERGYDGLTMRALARESGVSVPTLYNLCGGKDAIVAAQTERALARVASSVASRWRGSVVADILAIVRVAHSEAMASPDYYRALLPRFLAVDELRTIRVATQERYVALAAGRLADAAPTELCDWVDPHALARALFDHTMSVLEQWAADLVDDADVLDSMLAGAGLLLAGAATGDARARAEKQARTSQRALRRRRARRST